MFAFSAPKDAPYSVFDLSDKLRERGWQVPAYTMPDDATDIAVLRVVVREGFSRDMADMLLADIKKAVAHFEANPMSKPKDSGGQFAH